MNAAVDAGAPATLRSRLLRGFGFAIAGLLIATAVLLLLLRVILAGMPERAERVKSWVERQTRLRLEFDSLDARLRWYGPELVLSDLRILDQDGRQPMLAMREGSVALDLWNVLRAGEFVAGRVRFTGPTVTVLRLEDGTFRLLGLGDRPADRPPFDFDRLPAGHVQIEDATVHLRDLKSGLAPSTLRELDIVLRRDRDLVVARGSARLPPAMGTRIGFEAELEGTLAAPGELAGRVDFEGDRLVLAGFAPLLPRGIAQPLAGTGHVNARIVFAARRVRELSADFELRGLVLATPPRTLPPVEVLALGPPRREPGKSPLSMPVVSKQWIRQPVHVPDRVEYALLAGQLELRRLMDGWSFDAGNLRAVRATRVARSVGAAASLRGAFQGRPETRHSLTLEAHALRLAELWPLAQALAPRAADRWLGLAPQGEIRRLSLEHTRPRAGAAPVFSVDAEVSGLGVAASGAWPGVRGLTATLAGNERLGRIALRSPALEFEWPRLLADAPGAISVDGDLAWRRAGAGWTIGTDKLALWHPQLQAQGSFELSHDGKGESPVLRADVKVPRAEAQLVGRLLPYGRLKPRSTSWLRSAFAGGAAVDGMVHLEGDVRRFPFRDGGGEFRASFGVEDITLDYLAGFTPLRGGRGRVEIVNGGLRGELDTGQVGGLRLGHGSVTIADLKAPVIEVSASGSGDLGEALRMLQASPLGPVIGRPFMQLAGRGDTGFELRLHLPTAAMAEHDYEVRARLRSASISVPWLRAPAQDVSGGLEIRRRSLRSDDLHGNFLGGPFAVTVASVDGTAPTVESVTVAGYGRATGALLPGFIGLPAGIRMSGGADWQLDLAARRQSKGQPWPLQLAVTSDLLGLAIDAPPPFAKTADDDRPTALRLARNADDSDLDVRSGSAHARLVFHDQGGRLEFDRGALRFDGGSLALPARAGLRIDGDWPDFDLGSWLALGGDGQARRALSDWLGPVNVQLARVRLFGQQLRDVAAVLEATGREWQADLSGPDAEGRVTVPFDPRGGAPVVLDMRRLRLESAAPTAAGRPAASADPRRAPALSVSAQDFVWQGRRLGQLRAEVVRDPMGLRLQKFSSTLPELSINATGTWLVEGSGSQSSVDVQASSNDLAAASVALGYRPTIEAQRTVLEARLRWPGGPRADAVSLMDGDVHLELQDGQLRNVEPGAAGRVLGLMSLVELPRRLALDFRDVTDEGLAFDSVRGDFEIRAGNAYTKNLLLSGTAVDIGVAGRTGLASQDYDQTVIVSGNPGGPLAVAGALAAGPVVGAGVLVLAQLFKGQLKGLTRAYYRVTGPWSAPVVERVSGPSDSEIESQEAAAAAMPP